jgi:hypothetical protein
LQFELTNIYLKKHVYLLSVITIFACSSHPKLKLILRYVYSFIPRGHWCDINLNIHAPTEDKIDVMKDRFCEELEHVFDKFRKCHMKILLGDFNAKVDRENIFKPTIGSESLHEINNDNGVRVVNFATSKDLFLFLHIYF